MKMGWKEIKEVKIIKVYLFESDIDVLAKFHVLEHAFELGGESTPTLLLQFTKHAFLRVNTC
jgi:hypothetical protein